MPKISIIIPAYNVENYLEECLNSLLNQTLREIEMIIIDDGSSDATPKICDEFSKRDSRIVVVHQKNAGVSEARNKGISFATGEYVMFVDGDDWIEEDACETVYQHLKEKQADSLMFCYVNQSSKGAKKKEIFSQEKIVFEGEEITNRIEKSFIGLTGDELAHPERIDSTISVWGKVYKLDIIKKYHIKYINYNIVPSECQLFNIEYFSKAKKVVYVKEFLYHYRRNTESSVTKRYKKNVIEKWLYWIQYMKEYINQNYPENEKIFEAYYNRICFSVIPISGELLKKKNFRYTYRELKKVLNSEHYRNAYQKLEFKNMPIHWKIYFYLAKKRSVLPFYAMSKMMRILIGIRKK